MWLYFRSIGEPFDLSAMTEEDIPENYRMLKGLVPEAVYRLEGTERRFSGAALMYAGYSFPQGWGDYPAQQLHFVRTDGENEAHV